MQNNKSAAVRNARTAVTSAQNAGRQNTFNRAEEMGITIQKEWISTHDGRVRDSHAALDGVRVNNDRPFPNGLRYPGDPSGAPAEVYNCRCTMRSIIPKYNDAKRTEKTSASYAAWVISKTNKYIEKEIKNIKGGKGKIKELNSYTHNGNTYIVDGTNVKQNNSKRELEVAEIITEQLGLDVFLIPEIKGKYKGIETPDYLINGEKYDLKELHGKSTDAIRNTIHKHKGQGKKFIIDITDFKMDEMNAYDQAAGVFEKHNTLFVEEIIIVKDHKITKIYDRK